MESSCQTPWVIVVMAALQLWSSVDAKRPHIVFVLADDYGYNDVGYHGSEIKTPNLDELCSKGVRLENYYVQPSCTPSRSQFMSGRYQIHTGLQHEIIWHDQANALPRDTPTIADKMREAGYATHMVGKWHLGFYKTKYLPINRGFDTFYGFYLGDVSYYDHSRPFKGGSPSFLDLHDQDKPVRTERGHYSTSLYSEKAIEMIKNHNSSKPFFLYLSYQAVHSPLQVPTQYLKQYRQIPEYARRQYAGMVSAMDEGIGHVTQALKVAGMWEDTVFVFSTDNGGQPSWGGNNYPLRGFKGDLFEGGIRGVGFVHAANLKTAGTTSRALTHISDWYPTFVRLGGGSVDDVPLDGFDQWAAISNSAAGPRQEILYNIDPMAPRLGERLYKDTFDNRIRAGIRSGDWKLITGYPGSGTWNPAPRYTGDYATQIKPVSSDPKDKNLWLFNVKDDPRELKDVSSQHPDKVKELLGRLSQYNKTAVAPRYPPRPDPKGNPALLGGVWGPWSDGTADDLDQKEYTAVSGKDGKKAFGKKKKKKKNTTGKDDAKDRLNNNIEKFLAYVDKVRDHPNPLSNAVSNEVDKVPYNSILYNAVSDEVDEVRDENPSKNTVANEVNEVQGNNPLNNPINNDNNKVQDHISLNNPINNDNNKVQDHISLNNPINNDNNKVQDHISLNNPINNDNNKVQDHISLNNPINNDNNKVQDHIPLNNPINNDNNKVQDSNPLNNRVTNENSKLDNSVLHNLVSNVNDMVDNHPFSNTLINENTKVDNDPLNDPAINGNTKSRSIDPLSNPVINENTKVDNDPPSNPVINENTMVDNVPPSNPVINENTKADNGPLSNPVINENTMVDNVPNSNPVINENTKADNGPLSNPVINGNTKVDNGPLSNPVINEDTKVDNDPPSNPVINEDTKVGNDTPSNPVINEDTKVDNDPPSNPVINENTKSGNIPPSNPVINEDTKVDNDPLSNPVINENTKVSDNPPNNPVINENIKVDDNPFHYPATGANDKVTNNVIHYPANTAVKKVENTPLNNPQKNADDKSIPEKASPVPKERTGSSSEPSSNWNDKIYSLFVPYNFVLFFVSVIFILIAKRWLRFSFFKCRTTHSKRGGN